MASTEVKKPATPKLSKKFLVRKQNERKITSGKRIISHKRSLSSLTKKQRLAIKKRAALRKVEKPKNPRFPRAYAIQQEKKKLSLRKVQCFKDHKRHIRSSLKPGTVLILLAGKHKGKRVVFLRALDSGLLLRYVIATKTRINIRGVAVPKALTDKFFRRVDLKPKSKNVDKLFAEEPKKYSVSDERKKLQKEVDLSLLKAIRKHKSSKILAAYLKSMFSLSRKDYPHKMVF
nr:unnamed protein product [Spirometra erinaceieuropaei]